MKKIGKYWKILGIAKTLAITSIDESRGIAAPMVAAEWMGVMKKRLLRGTSSAASNACINAAIRIGTHNGAKSEHSLAKTATRPAAAPCNICRLRRHRLLSRS